MSDNYIKCLAPLYREHGTSVRSFTEKLLNGRYSDHVDNIVQETFVRTAWHLSSGNKVESPKQFLFAIAHSVVTVFLNRNQHAEIDTMPSADDLDGDAETDFRRVWGPSRSELAKQLGVSERTASTYADRGWQMVEDYCHLNDIRLEGGSDHE